VENEKDNELPAGWVETKLDQICEILDSFRIPINNEERIERIKGISEDKLFPYYGATGQVGVIDEYLFDGEYILLGEDGAPFLDAFKNKAYIVNGKFWVNNHAHILKAHLSNQFVLHYLNQFGFRGYVSGTTRLKLTQLAMKEIPVPLPPLAEQHRIVAKLEELFSELDKGVENLRAAQQQLKVYRQAVLQWAFEGKLTEEWRAIIGDATSNGQEFLNRIIQERKTVYKNELAQHEAAASNNKTKRPNKPEFYSAISDEEYSKLLELPSQWVWSKVGNLCQSIVPNRDKPKSFTGEVPWLTTPDIDSAKITVDFQLVKLGLTAEETEKYNARVIPPNSVIMTCVGSFGVVCVNAKACVINQQLHAFITHKYINSRYLAYALKNMRNWMEQHATSTTVAYLNKTNCNSIPIPVCDITEQRQIVAEIESRLSICDKLEETIEQSLLQAEALRQSILKKAFAGKLVPQDPSDEPAEKLLARIRAERAATTPVKKPSKGRTAK